MRSALRPAATLLLVFTVLTGVAYPATITGIALLLFPHQANGSLIYDGPRVVGSALIGQAFGDPADFWGRPSVTSPGPYNASASAASNLGPSNPALRDAVALRVAALRAADPGNDAPVPVELVTASASGLDPHLSPAAAYYQAGRVARIRGRSEQDVRQMIDRETTGRALGILGEPYVHVLRLNRALEEKAPRP